MAFKTFSLTDDIDVTIYKRKGASSLRLSVTSTGEIRVSMPTWTPYAAGLTFARSRMGWIAAQKKPALHLQDGFAIGKAHHLRLVATSGAKKVSSRVIPGSIVVRYPVQLSFDDEVVQKIVVSACIRALRSQAERLLPQRVAQLAEQHGFTYQDVAIKQLKSRWGSCDQHNHIVLNLFLMQLSWDLIDYVILHELTHTEHLNHGPEFWARMKLVIPNVTQRRKDMRNQSPSISSK